MLQGDIQNKWRTSEFRMFKGGSIWRPPPMNPYTQGMPEELVEPEVEPRKGSLSPTQRDRLEDLIRNMTPERLKVAEVMVFCMEHSEAAEEICDCILESLSNPSTALYKKIARLYLISDILHNCGVKITNASYYRRGNLLMLIHHTIEFVIREGPMFEAMIMNRELNNPMFSECVTHGTRRPSGGHCPGFSETITDAYFPKSSPTLPPRLAPQYRSYLAPEVMEMQ
ncbi:U2 snRNP-associated SURP domain-containing protein [Homalodisca vitripennis]|nr:U2 snRNP-associated SURP domain-containing protein [Homalodisca vitripennis]